MQVYEANSANVAWKKAADYFRSGQLPTQVGRGGNTREIVPVCFQIAEPRNRWVFSREPALSVAFALVEVVGIVNGRNDSAYLNYFNPALPRFAGTGPTFHGAYGFRLRQHFGVDQMKRAADALSSFPDSRQVVLQLWDASLDLPEDDGKPRAADIPCNVCSMLKIRDGKLLWTQVMRSNDLFRGTPYNFVQFTTLQEIIAGWVGVDVGTFTHFADSLHVYEQDLYHLLAYSSVDEAMNTDTLAFPYDEAKLHWLALNTYVNELSGGRTGVEIESLMLGSQLPKPFRNILAIIAADAARRSNERELAVALGRTCDNPALRLCWERWNDRKDKEERVDAHK